MLLVTKEQIDERPESVGGGGGHCQAGAGVGWGACEAGWGPGGPHAAGAWACLPWSGGFRSRSASAGTGGVGAGRPAALRGLGSIPPTPPPPVRGARGPRPTMASASAPSQQGPRKSHPTQGLLAGAALLWVPPSLPRGRWGGAGCGWGSHPPHLRAATAAHSWGVPAQQQELNAPVLQPCCPPPPPPPQLCVHPGASGPDHRPSLQQLPCIPVVPRGPHCPPPPMWSRAGGTPLGPHQERRTRICPRDAGQGGGRQALHSVLRGAGQRGRGL